MGSFNDEYQKLRKKRKEEEQEDSKSSVPYQRLLNPDQQTLDTSSPVNYTSYAAKGASSDIAPVSVSQSGKEDDEKWYEKIVDIGAFEDGYQRGDITKTILGTAGHVVVGAAKGLFKGAEGISDLILYGASGLTDLVGADEAADFLKNAAKNDVSDIVFGDTQRQLEGLSVLGDTGAAVTEGIGQIGFILASGGAGAASGLGTFGTTALTTGVTGLSSMGSGMSEAYQAGATDEQAFRYGLLSGTVEAGTELIFGGLGKAVKAVGISKGLSSLDDVFAKKLSSKISSQFWSNMVEFGVKASAEGTEEVLAGIGSAVSKKLTYMSDEELTQLIKDENLLEQFVVGAVTSGIAQSGIVPGMKQGSLSEANKSGQDFISGFTQNEQAVVDKEFENRLAEAEQDGNKLSKKEQNDLYDKVIKDLERGYISTDTIEEVLGGEDYSNYQSEIKRQEDIDNELNELRNMKSGEMSDIQMERMAELKAMQPNTELVNSLKFGIDEKIRNALSSDRNGKGSYLLESYNEQTRRGKAFEADLSKYDTKQAEVIKKAIDSGILNNTNRTHDFVDMVAKISADKGVLFDFANNAKLKESGFAVDGKFVNGYVTKDGITVNIDSNKALNSIVGHEITHVLEGTDLYNELQNTIIEYAKSKGDYQSRLDELTKLYEGVEGADVSAELTADLVGDYLFTDEDFINHLSTSNRNVFQKIYDEIKYLYKVATAGSKQARELEKVKRAFDKAYREGGKASGDTKYSLSDSDGKKLTKEQSEYFKDSKMRDDNGNLKVMYHGSQDAGFHIFDANMSDDDTSFFFVDRNDVAASYSGTSETYAPKAFNSVQDANKFFAEINATEYEVVENDGKYTLLEDGDEVATSDDLAEIYEEWRDWSGLGYGDANYKVYLNLTNPLVVDGKGRPWNKIDAEFSQEVYDKYQSLTAEEKAALVDLAEWEDFRIFNSEIQEAVGNELASAYAKMGENVNIYDLFSVAADNFSEESMRENARHYLKTRDFAQRAKEGGYDGVIFKNIIDNGGYSNGDEGASTVAIAFESNQIKSVANDKPTKQADIRYSLSDSEGTHLTKEQQEYFKDSKIRNENGSLKVMHHGSTETFTVFDKTKAKSSGTYGKGFYFTDSTSHAGTYGNTIDVYLNITNPLQNGTNDITKEQIRKFVEAIAENEDYGIDNYGYDATVDSVTDSVWGKSDFGMILDLNISCVGNMVEAIELFNEVNGTDYNGIVAPTETVAFYPNQIKSIDNKAPTANPDIRYSLSEDSKGRQLSKEQQEFFADSQIRVSEVDGWKNTISPDGALFPVYHGTNSDEFSEFDRDTIGSANDTGWYGKGFYFAFTEGEASYYGNRVLECYLNVKKPFFFSEEMNSYDGQTHGDVMFDFGAFVLNLSDKFPKIAQNTFIEVSDKGDYKDIVKIPFPELAQEIKSIYESDRFQAVEVEDQYEGTTYQYRFSRDIDSMEAPENIKKLIKDHWINDTWTVDWLKEKGTITREEHNEIMDLFEKYGYTQFSDKWIHGKFDSKEYAEKNRLSAVISYLRDYKYGYFGQHMPEYFMEHYVGDSFTTELRDKGYDGILQSRFGDEIVVFDSNQIKLTNNKKPTSSPDINHSLSDTNEAPTKRYGSYNVYGKDIRLYGADDIAPVGVAENAITTEHNSVDMGDEFAPVVNSYTIEQEIDEIGKEIEALVEESTDLYNKGEEAKAMELVERINELSTKDRQLREQAETLKAQEEAEYKAYIDSLAEVEPPVETERAYSEADTTPLDDKTLKVLTRNVRNVLSAMPKENKAIREIIEKYSTTDQKKSELFRELKEKFGDKYEYHRYSDIAEAKKVLRTYKFNVSEQVKGDIADYRDYKKSHNVRTSKSGLSVDVLYEELSGLYPGLFPADITNETDRFERISEVSVMPAAEWVKVAELSDNEIMQAVDFIHNEVTQHKNNATRKAAEANARAYIDDVAPSRAKEITENVSDPTLKYQGVYRETPIKTTREKIAEQIENFNQDIANLKRHRADSIVRFNRDIARLQEEYNAKANKNTKVANNILIQIENLQTNKNNVDAMYEQKISNLETKVEKMSTETYQTAKQRQSKTQEYAEWAKNLIGDTTHWVDKKLGISYKVNTLKRNLRDVVRDAQGNRDIEKADAIYDELQGTYNHNEAELNRESNRIKKVFADMKITSVEDVYIQMLGEFMYNPDTTLTPDDVNNYYEAHKSKIDKDKVNEAIKLARANYDSLLERVNEVLREQGMKEIPYRKGYFPHFTETKQSWLAKLFNWKTQDTEIPTSIAGLTEQFTPNRSWQSFNKQRFTDATDYSFTKGFDTYVQGALDWIYHIEDIQKRRAFENELRYIHSEKGIQDKVEALFNNEEYDADELQEQIDLVYAEARNPLNNFVTDLHAGTNKLASKKSSMDRGMEELTNRKFYSTMTNLSNRVSANMVGGSVSSALTNFIPITQSWGEVSPVSSLRAMGETIRSTFKDDGVIDKSDFLTNRLKKSENLYKTTWDKITDKAAFMMEGIDFFTSQTVWRSKYLENIANGMSESEAIKNADQFAEGVMAGRSRGNQPTLFDSKNPLIKTLTAFQLEVNNQYGYMFKDMPQDVKNESTAKLVKGYAAMFIGAYAYNALYSALTGRDAAFDPIGIIQELLGDLFDDEEEKEPIDAVLGFAENVAQEIPFVGGLLGGGRVPISSALPYDGNVFDFLEGSANGVEGGINLLRGPSNDLSEEEAEAAIKEWQTDLETATKEWLRPLYYLAMPMGGGQLKKTIEGLSMFSEDHPIAGSYTDSGSLRFPVDDTLANRLQAGIFGQYASQNARDYFDNDIAPLNEKQTQEFIDVGMDIHDYWDYREGLSQYKTLAEKADYINSLDLTDEQKNILINNIADRKEDIDMSDYDNYGSFEEFDYANKYPEKYEFWKQNGISYEDYVSGDDDTKAAYNWAYENPDKFTLSKAVASDVVTYRQYTKELNDIKADKDSDGKSISGSRKEKVIDYINNLDADYGSKIILFKSEYPADDTYNVDIVNYLNSREDISYKEMETILKELGFNVDSNGRITWD